MNTQIGLKGENVDRQLSNILVISQENIGDVIMSSAALKMIRQLYPQARITLMTSEACKDILLDGRIVNAVIPDTFPKGKFAQQIYKVKKFLQLRRYKFDACFFFGHPKRRITKICKLAGIPVRVAASHTMAGKLNKSPARNGTHVITVTPPPHNHVADYYQDIVQGFDNRGQRQTTFLHVPDKNVPVFQKRNAKIVALCFKGSGSNKHRWPKEYFHKVIGKLHQDHNCTLVAPIPQEHYAQTRQFFNDLPVEILPQKNLMDCARLLSQVDLLLSINTGLTHMAAALNVPVISLSATNAKSTFPYADNSISLSCSASCPECHLASSCRVREEGEDYIPPCMLKLTPEKVFPYILAMLDGKMPAERMALV